MNIDSKNFTDVNRYLTERNIQFLNESNKIESITEIDYHNPAYQVAEKGHFGAFVLSQESARNREPLTIKMIKEWQKLITEEQRPHGHEIDAEGVGRIRNPSNLQRNVRVGSHIPPDYTKVPTLLEHLVEEINASLKEGKADWNDASYCEILGNDFQMFESIHPFIDGNGRTGRLLANYIATYCKRPIAVFNSDMIEVNKYYKAHESKQAMCCFMAEKIQETVFSENGRLLVKNADISNSSAIYQSENGEEVQTVHWHLLNQAVRQWQAK